MNDRIHRYLDGELPFSELDPHERRELQAWRSALHGALRVLPDDPAPDLTLDVMDRLDALDGPEGASGRVHPDADGPLDAVRRAWSALWRRRPLHVRPAVAIAVVAFLTLIVTSDDLPRDRRVAVPVRDGGTAIADAADDGRITVIFRLEASQASSVRLAGDFTGWQPTLELARDRSGVWNVEVPLVPGVHEYAFVVDGGTWVPDPHAEAVSDGFGGTNSRVAVLDRGGRS